MSNIFSDRVWSLKKACALLVVSIVLILLDSKNPEWFTCLRTKSHAAMQPIYELSLYPSSFGRYVQMRTQSKQALLRENYRLQVALMQANAKLQQQDHLAAQNARLQGILSTTTSNEYNLLLAQVVGTDTNPAKQIVVLNKGINDGVRIGQTVIDENGILGQIINVYPNTSRLLLLTDEQQSVSVVVLRTGQRAMVSGKGNAHTLSLDYIFKAADVQEGDVLISSGLGGRIPAGYKVGTIKNINESVSETDNFVDIDVSPAANFIGSSYALILQDKSQGDG